MAKIHFCPALHVLENPRGRITRVWCGMVIKPTTDVTRKPKKVTCKSCRKKAMDPKNNVAALLKAFANAVS